MGEDGRNIMTPQRVAQEVANRAPKILQRWSDGIALSGEALRAMPHEERIRPILAMLLALQEVSVLVDAEQHLTWAVPLKSGTEHGQARAQVPGYTERNLYDEYNLLRRCIMEDYFFRGAVISAGIIWLHRQIDLLSSAALSTFETVRQHSLEAWPQMSIALDNQLLIGGRGDVIWAWDAATGLVNWGQQLVTVYGYPPPCLEGPCQWWLDHIHPGDRMRIVEEFQSQLARQLPSCTFAYRFSRKDGSWVDVRHRVWRDQDKWGQARRSIGLIVGIDQPLIVDDALTGRSLEQQRPPPYSVEPLASAIAMVDLQGRCVYATRPLLNFCNCTLDALIGCKLEEFLDEDARRFVATFKPRTLAGEFVSFELPVRSADGMVRWYLVSFLPYRGGTEKMTGYVVHIIDLLAFVGGGAPQQRLERLSQQYQVLLRELQQVVHAPTEAVIAHARSQARVAHLEQRSQLREQFVTMLTHDLRNPLTAARLTVERLERYIDPESASAQTLLKRALVNLDRTNGMVTNLLDANRVECGERLDVNPVRHELRAAVAEVVKDFLPGQGRIRLQLPPHDVVGMWDPGSVRRILENLLSNAVKYGDARAYITGTITETVNGAHLSVHNWGNPISQEGRAALFRPFVRAAVPPPNGEGGWGVGLALVQALAEAHGGRVDVHSTLEAGTTFDVFLPVQYILPAS